MPQMVTTPPWTFGRLSIRRGSIETREEPVAVQPGTVFCCRARGRLWTGISRTRSCRPSLRCPR